MNAAVREIPLQLPVKLLPIFKPRRFKIMHGGRGGAKSHSVAQALLALGHKQKLRILCVRQVQKSLKESSMQVLIDYIEKLGLGGFYEVLKTEIRGANGTTFAFSGLQDHTAQSIKSFEGADIVWVEEAHSVTAHALGILIPTIRKAGSEIWATFNPDQDSDYVYDRFVKHRDPDAWVVQINWRDNPWFGEVMDTERRKLKAINEDLYQHVWEGKCRSLAGLLFKRKWFKFYTEAPDNLRPYMASDYATMEPDEDNPNPDYTEHGIGSLDEDGNLYLTDWYSGQDSPETWIDEAVKLIKRRRPLMWFEEKGVILRSLTGAIAKRLRERKVFIVREGLASAGSKAERALGFAARASAGAVYLPDPDRHPDKAMREWSLRLLNQLCAFTGQDGRVDDGVDVCSLLARGLDYMANARKPANADTDPIKPFSRRHIESIERDEREVEDERKRHYR